MNKGALKATAVAVFAVMMAGPGMFPAMTEDAAAAARKKESALANASREARKATVGIFNRPGNTSGNGQQDQQKTEPGHFVMRGTGFHTGNGYIVTALHVVSKEDRNGDKITVDGEISVLTDDMKELPLRLVGYNQFLDVAVYEADRRRGVFPPGSVKFSKEEPSPGDEVFSVGFPLGWGPVFSYGRSGNENAYLSTLPSRAIQADMSFCGGNSGGAIFNNAGEITGMAHAIIQDKKEGEEERCSRMTFGVPGVMLARAVDDIVKGNSPRFPLLGARLNAVKLGEQWRVAVSGVEGAALKAGMQKGDVIMSIDDVPVTTAAELKNYIVGEKNPGDQTKVRVLRGNEEKVLSVTLGGM